MQALIGNGKYKVIKVLFSDRDIDVCLCSRIDSNGGATVIADCYKSRETVHRLVPVFFRMKNEGMPSDFQEIITADSSIYAIFKYHSGISFSEYFKHETEIKFDERIGIADMIIQHTLEFDLIDDEIASSVLSAENIAVNAANREIGFNYILKPTEHIAPNFRGKRLGEILTTIFPHDRYLPEEIEDLTEMLLSGEVSGCSAAYSAWRGISKTAFQKHEAYLKESYAQYFSRKLKRKKDKLKDKFSDNSGT